MSDINNNHIKYNLTVKFNRLSRILKEPIVKDNSKYSAVFLSSLHLDVAKTFNNYCQMEKIRCFKKL